MQQGHAEFALRGLHISGPLWMSPFDPAVCSFKGAEDITLKVTIS